MEIQKAIHLVQLIFDHEQVRQMAAVGDSHSRSLTRHDFNHLLEVAITARQISHELVKAGTVLSVWEQEVVIPLGALLHDIGRAFPYGDHAAIGAEWSNTFLSEITLPYDDEHLPDETIQRICKIVRMHRSKVVLRSEFDDRCWAVVVLADKFVGDENRVRPFRALVYSIIARFQLQIEPFKDGLHDRVNFGIKDYQISISGNRLIFSLIVDHRVCQPSLILETFAERYSACKKSAEYLGYEFEIQTIAYRSDIGPIEQRRQLGF